MSRGDDGSPNATEKDTGADDIRQGKQLYEQLGRELVDGERMQVCDHCDENTQATARSKHAGGVFVAHPTGEPASFHRISDVPGSSGGGIARNGALIAVEQAVRA